MHTQHIDQEPDHVIFRWILQIIHLHNFISSNTFLTLILTLNTMPNIPIIYTFFPSSIHRPRVIHIHPR